MSHNEGKPGESVEQAAQRWWGGKRPLGWANAQHVANPTVNCTTEPERALALAVAASLSGPGIPPTSQGEEQ